MKKIILSTLTFISTFSFANDVPLRGELKESMTYMTGGIFTLVTVPTGVNIGFGKRWYGNTFAVGVSANMGACVGFIPMIDVQCEGFCFLDKNIYFGLQLGFGAAKSHLKDYEYQDYYGQIKKLHFDNITIYPILKIIPIGVEWGNGSFKKFFNLSIFPGGASFNYGWKI